jgi:Nucleotidyl transferase AbiEii toxin, Type IV TA system
MPEFFQLSRAEQLDALNVAANASGRPPHLLEKDIWVVWTLRHLFTGPYAEHLVFKGGTSLSKAYGVIRRFSEDVDLTYNICSIAHDLVGDADAPLPASKSQGRKWSEEIYARLCEWVIREIAPRLQSELERNQLPATVSSEGDTVTISYEPLSVGTGYIASNVRLEFGARSTGEPSQPRTVQCDAAEYLPTIEFPTATAMVMLPERTFWEKATAIHVFCAKGTFRGGKGFARHWHDIARLDEAGFAQTAITDKGLAKAVADHKSAFFAEKNSQGEPIDYHAAVAGGLRLVPDDDALILLRADYRQMVDDGLFLDEAESFELLLDRCRIIENKANKTTSR